MSTESLILRPQSMSGIGLVSRWGVLLGAAALSLPFWTSPYFWGVIPTIFIGLFIFFFISYKPYQGRYLYLLLWLNAAIMILGTAFLYSFLTENLSVVQVPTGNGVANMLWGDRPQAFVFAFVVNGMLAILVDLLLGMFVAAVAFFLRKWEQTDGISFRDTFMYVLRAFLWGNAWYVVIDEVKDKDESKVDEKAQKNKDYTLMKTFGGPGWLTVHPGLVVVMHQHGKTTRAEGAGSFLLARGEKVKAILPLDALGGVQEINDVLTSDRIYLNLKVAHVVQLESDAVTRARFQQVVETAQTELADLQGKDAPDKIKAAEKTLDIARKKLAALDKARVIGDDYDQCYEFIARDAAAKCPKGLWESVKQIVASNMKDAMMSEHSEKLFRMKRDEDDLTKRVNMRVIREIEEYVKNQCIKGSTDKGLRLVAVDIGAVQFPLEIRAKVEDEVKTLIQERIQQTETRIAKSQAEATVITARAKSQARALQGRGEGEAQAATFREILRELQRDENLLSKEDIAQHLLKMISSTVSVKELESFFKATSFRQEQGVSEGRSRQKETTEH